MKRSEVDKLIKDIEGATKQLSQVANQVGKPDLQNFRVLIDTDFKPGEYIDKTTNAMGLVGFHMSVPMTAKGFRIFARCYAAKEGTTIDQLTGPDANHYIINPSFYNDKIKGVIICEVHVVGRSRDEFLAQLLETSFPTRFMEITAKVEVKEENPVDNV